MLHAHHVCNAKKTRHFLEHGCVCLVHTRYNTINTTPNTLLLYMQQHVMRKKNPAEVVLLSDNNSSAPLPHAFAQQMHPAFTDLDTS